MEYCGCTGPIRTCALCSFFSLSLCFSAPPDHRNIYSRRSVRSTATAYRHACRRLRVCGDPESGQEYKLSRRGGGVSSSCRRWPNEPHGSSFAGSIQQPDPNSHSGITATAPQHAVIRVIDKEQQNSDSSSNSRATKTQRSSPPPARRVLISPKVSTVVDQAPLGKSAEQNCQRH